MRHDVVRERCARLADAHRADRFHDECGVFGIWGHEEAAHITYLGLYALQHRGQEACGIVASNGHEHIAHRAQGLVADTFGEGTLQRLAGRQIMFFRQRFVSDLFMQSCALAGNSLSLDSSLSSVRQVS